MQKWEYARLEIYFGDDPQYSLAIFTPNGKKEKVIKGNRKRRHHDAFDERVALLGLDGWELVSVMPYKGWNAQYGTTGNYLWFKRPLSN